MAYPKDAIAFLYVQREDGEVVFTSKAASRFCPVPSSGGGFMFDDLVAGAISSKAFKDQTRSQVPLMNTYRLPLWNSTRSCSWDAYICEMFIKGGFHGVIFTAESGAEGVDYLASLILNKGARSRAPLLAACEDDSPSAQSITRKIVEVFETDLIHFPKQDQWFTSGGKERFADQVKFHVLRNIPLELTLPAFPAKSCNPAKVSGKRPDKGEELAIHTMKIVADSVKAIYPPGVHFNIVSDGHVFSDLVGIEDSDVDTYGEMFRKMANDLYPGLITFYGLDDFLFLQDVSSEETSEMIQELSLEHPVKTELTERAEIARKIMTFLFGSDESFLKQEIETDKETTGLYCGFKRFMLEDLAQHKSCKALTTNVAKRKLCSRVAFLMIQRNRAYSTMVEWLFPVQLRISIHPHPNRGPKYGINLIHPSLVAMQRKSDEKLFHTPTPWHNAVVEMSDGKFMLLPSAMIQAGFEVNGVMVNKVVTVNYANGRPSHFKQAN